MNSYGKNRTGAIEYPLDEKRVKEGTAFVLKGNANFTKHLIKTCKYKYKYVSGTLRFADEDVVSEVQERKIMDSFEKMFFAGLDPSIYHILWVKHVDKGVTELNYIVPQVRLDTGKSLDLYSHKRDVPIFSQWQDGINKRYGLANPYDESRERTQEERHKAKYSGKYKQNFVINRGNIDAHIATLVADRTLINREEIVKYLKSQEFKVKESKGFISIKHPKIGKKALRLKVSQRDIYGENFNSVDLSDEQLAAAAKILPKDKSKKAPDKPIDFDADKYAEYLKEREIRHVRRFGSGVKKDEMKDLIEKQKKEENERKKRRDDARRIENTRKNVYERVEKGARRAREDFSGGVAEAEETARQGVAEWVTDIQKRDIYDGEAGARIGAGALLAQIQDSLVEHVERVAQIISESTLYDRISELVGKIELFGKEDELIVQHLSNRRTELKEEKAEHTRGKEKSVDVDVVKTLDIG